MLAGNGTGYLLRRECWMENANDSLLFTMIWLIKLFSKRLCGGAGENPVHLSNIQAEEKSGVYDSSY